MGLSETPPPLSAYGRLLSAVLEAQRTPPTPDDQGSNARLLRGLAPEERGRLLAEALCQVGTIGLKKALPDVVFDAFVVEALLGRGGPIAVDQAERMAKATVFGAVPDATDPSETGIPVQIEFSEKRRLQERLGLADFAEEKLKIASDGVAEGRDALKSLF